MWVLQQLCKYVMSLCEAKYAKWVKKFVCNHVCKSIILGCNKVQGNCIISNVCFRLWHEWHKLLDKLWTSFDSLYLTLRILFILCNVMWQNWPNWMWLLMLFIETWYWYFAFLPFHFILRQFMDGQFHFEVSMCNLFHYCLRKIFCRMSRRKDTSSCTNTSKNYVSSWKFSFPFLL